MQIPSLRLENKLLKDGCTLIAGVDEAGRGPLAGPVVACAVILPKDIRIRGLRDSKLLTPRAREKLFCIIHQKALSIGIAEVDEKEIDRVNIHNAAMRAMKMAVDSLSLAPDHILVDGRFRIKGLSIPQTAMVRGDAKSSSIAAASIIAKVTRDRIMVKLGSKYPGYGLAGHKGYGTEEHLRALRKLGPLPIHRASFRPVGDLLNLS